MRGGSFVDQNDAVLEGDFSSEEVEGGFGRGSGVGEGGTALLV